MEPGTSSRWPDRPCSAPGTWSSSRDIWSLLPGTRSATVAGQVVATGGHAVCRAGHVGRVRRTIRRIRRADGRDRPARRRRHRRTLSAVVEVPPFGAEAKAISVAPKASSPAWAVARTRPKQAVSAIPAQTSFLPIPHLPNLESAPLIGNDRLGKHHFHFIIFRPFVNNRRAAAA